MTQTEEDLTPDVPDEIELLDTGRVRISLDGKTITLRCIKAGELKKLKRAYFEVSDKILAVEPKNRSDTEIDSWISWLRLVVATLGDAKLPAGKAADSLPGAWCSLGFAAKLINHWQSAPLPRGAGQPL